MKRNLRLDVFLFYFSVFMPFILGYWLDYPIFHSELTEILFGKNPYWRAITQIGWQTSIFMAALYVFAASYYGSPLRKDEQNVERFIEEGWPQKKRLIVTYVSRGENWQALKNSIEESKKLLDDNKINYEMEVVTDFLVEDKIGIDQVLYFLVPEDFQTKLGSQFKARALQYLLEEREKRLKSMANTWILHLDEESEITLECLAGISKYLREPDADTTIGQGEIKYNGRTYAQNLLVTAADSRRTGDDLTRFRIQYKLFKRPLFGMHGSYILLPAAIEHKISFDHSSKGSITEVAYFAVKAWEQKIKFTWVEGFIREQSPLSIKAILKQRRRWWSGLATLSLDNDLQLKHRLLIAYMILWWLISIPLMILFGIRLMIIQVTFYQFVIAMIGYFSFRTFGPVYMVGAYRNLYDAPMSNLKKVWLYTLILLLAPFCILIEGVASLYAVAIPIKVFEVVDKV